MVDPEHPVDFRAVLERIRWAVRSVAAGEADPNDPYRGLYVSDDLALTLGAQQPPLELEQRFELVCQRLALDALDRAVLAVCAAPEVHPDFGRLFGYLNDDLTRQTASPRLAATLLSGPGVTAADVIACFDVAARLPATGAVRLEPAGPLADRAATVGAQLAAWLVGANLSDPGFEGRLRRVDRPRLPFGRGDSVARLRALLRAERALPLVVSGEDGVLALAEAAGTGAVVLDALATTEPAACADLALAAALEQRIAVVDELAELPAAGRRSALERIYALPCRPVLHVDSRDDAIVLADHSVISVEVAPPAQTERATAWETAAQGADVDGVAGRYRLSVRRIEEAAAAARAEAATRGVGALDAELLALGARTASSRRIGELADLLAPGPTWDDLVLPDRQMTGLHTLSSFLCHRERVLTEWRYDRIVTGQGLTALFAGESGTGKTLAARVVAAAAGLDVYRVDLSGLFSKWVGETEKNLDRIFRAAESSNAVLFFDEADVVFGKRTDTADASDRYANLETAFLLQRIEAYDGVVVLATNLASNMDSAFVRRIDVLVDFPPPKTPTRRRLWRTLLGDSVPLGEDIDLDFLSERFELTGGGIRNCTVVGALLAAEEDEPIQMRHLVRAVAMEYGKLGRLTLEADFEHFHDLLDSSANGRGRARP